MSDRDEQTVEQLWAQSIMGVVRAHIEMLDRSDIECEVVSPTGCLLELLDLLVDYMTSNEIGLREADLMP
jgi:hypothetical protein